MYEALPGVDDGDVRLGGVDSTDAAGGNVLEQRGYASSEGVVVQAGRDVNLRTGLKVRTRYREQVRQIAPRQLHDRASELSELAEFARSPEMDGQYRWWRADAWAGKSALLSWFVLNPPEGVRVVSFFVTARLPGQSDRAAFAEAVVEQLLTLLGQGAPPLLTRATQEAHLLGLLTEAAQACRARGETLLLVVDGLDEDRGFTTRHDAYSVAALLPVTLPPGARVVVSGRPAPPLPADVEPRHPLRDPTVVRMLSVSPHAQVLRREMERDVKRLLGGSAVERDLLGLMTASGGGLTADDLAELTGTSPWQIRDHLTTATGRSFTRRPASFAVDGAAEIYLLGHEEVQVTAQQILSSKLDAYRERIHRWAEDHHRRGWPSGTPEYLLRGYHTMLIALGDLDRAARLCTAADRHNRLLAVTGGDSAALTQIAATLDGHLARQPVDLPTVARLAVHRDHLKDRNSSIPTSMPALLARLGRSRHAIALADSITDRATRSEALLELAAALIQTGQYDDAGATFDRAVEAAHPVAGRTWSGRLLAELARTLTRHGRTDQAMELADVVPGPELRCQVLLEIVVTLARLEHPDDASRVLDRALQTVRSVADADERSGPLASVAVVTARLGRPDEALELARSVTDFPLRGRSLSHVAGALVRAGRHQDAERVLVEALCVARSVAEQDERSRVLAHAVSALVCAGLHDEARRVIEEALEEALEGTLVGADAFTDSDDRNSAVIYAVETAVRTGHHELGLGAVERIERKGLRRRAALKAAESLVVVGRHDDADRIFDSLLPEVCAENDDWQIKDVLTALAHAGHHDRALAAVHPVIDWYCRGRVLISVIGAMLRDSRVDEATEVARSITKEFRSSALTMVADSLINVGDNEGAALVLGEALDAARRRPDDYMTRQMALGLAEALDRLGYHDDAAAVFGCVLEIVRSDVRSDSKNSALNEVAASLRAAGRSRQALSVVLSITDEREREQALVETAAAVAGSGQYYAALDIAHSVTDETRQSMVLSNTALVLLRDRYYDEAIKTILRSLDMTSARPSAGLIDAVVMTATTVGGVGRNEQAGSLFTCLWTMVLAVTDDRERCDVMVDVAQALAEKGRPNHAAWALDQALKVAGGIAEPYFLSRVSKVFKSVGRLGRAVEVANSISDLLVQRWTMQDLMKEMVEPGRRAREFELVRAIIDAGSENSVELAVRSLAGFTTLDSVPESIRSIKDHGRRDVALSKISRVLIRIDSYRYEAVVAASAITDSDRQGNVLIDVAKVLTGAAHDQVRDFGRHVLMDSGLGKAFVKLAEVLVAAGHHEDAIAVTSSLADPEQRGWFMMALAGALSSRMENRSHELAALALQVSHWSHLDLGALLEVSIAASRAMAAEWVFLAECRIPRQIGGGEMRDLY